jgi:type 1 glutamine amidotransferase
VPSASELYPGVMSARYVLTLFCGTLLLGFPQVASPERSADPKPRVLVFTKTAGFRHESIPAAIAAVRDLGAANGFVVDATEDSDAFTNANLARYDAIVFLMTTGDVLDERQERAFEGFIRRGGGFAGVHSAADTEYGWAWYGGLVGAYFKSHPQIQRATVRVVNRRHPSTAGLPRTWTRTDEWYNFARNPRPSVHVIAMLDEASYSPGPDAMGSDHPIAWWQAYQGGRAWYTAGGHTAESYSDPLFRRHLLGGIRYAAGLTPPRIVRLTTALQGRRLRVALVYRSCLPCAGELRVRDVLRARLQLAGGRGDVTTRLPAGRTAVTVTLTDPKTGVRDSASRRVLVR